VKLLTFKSIDKNEQPEAFAERVQVSIAKSLDIQATKFSFKDALNWRLKLIGNRPPWGVFIGILGQKKKYHKLN
jgi:hypothetical protein